MRKPILFSAFAIIISIATTNAQIVNIPDANFKTYLVGNAAINTNMDTEIQVSEATAFTGAINSDNLAIFDFTGISAFVNLTFLGCGQNSMTSLDLSSNIALTFVSCANGVLTSITLPPSITFLECYNNDLVALNVAACPNLYHLATGINPITSMDISNNPLITLLNVNEMPLLSYLNLSNGNNINITTLNAYGNPNLTCIQVDSVEYSNANWTGAIDSIASFNEYCSPANTEDYTLKIEVLAYPNPSHHVLNLSTNDELNTTYNIIDISGRVLSNGNIQGNNALLNIENLPNGVYFLKIGEKNPTNIKFIKK